MLQTAHADFTRRQTIQEVYNVKDLNSKTYNIRCSNSRRWPILPITTWSYVM